MTKKEQARLKAVERQSAREARWLRAIEMRLEGKTYKEIGVELGVSMCRAVELAWAGAQPLADKYGITKDEACELGRIFSRMPKNFRPAPGIVRQ